MYSQPFPMPPAGSIPPGAMYPWIGNTSPPTSAGTNPGAVGPQSVWDVYRAAVPEMEVARDRNISQAMAQAGLGGNRFSTNSQNEAARIGAETGLSQNRLLTELLHGQANQNQDRALQSTVAALGFGQQEQDRALAAAGQGAQIGQLVDQMMRSRHQDLFSMGQWEDERARGIQDRVYQDWAANRLGYLPMLMQYMGGQWGPSQGAPVTTTTGATPGLLDYLAEVVPWFFLGGGG